MKKLVVLLAVLAVVTVSSVASAQSLTTLFAADNGGSNGGVVYFDLTVGSNPIVITALDTNTAEFGSNSMDVHRAVGTFNGNEGNAAFFGAPVATGTVDGMGVDVPSPVSLSNNISLNANTTYAMALILGPNGGHDYTNGDGSNQNFANGDISIALGSAENSFGSGVFSPRVWNGTVYYRVVPEPASFSLLGLAGLALLRLRRR